MDGGPLLNPRGPLPPGIYWRRRLALTGAVVLLLVVGAYSCTGDDPKKASLSTAVMRTPTPAVAGTPTAKPTPTPNTTPKPTRTPSADASAPCPATALKVAATADRKRYAAGVRPVLMLSVTNTGKVTCTRDLGQKARELRLTSGNDRVWSSDDCSPGGTADRVVLESGERRTFAVTWARRRSQPGCPGGQPVAAPGTYRVIARLGQIEVPGTAFLVD